jgi:hypothetical protein
MRIPLSITRSYRPNWKLWEGIREIIQNAKDAEIEHNAPFSVEHSGTTLTVTNEGCTLNHRALLLGETSKNERSDLIGQWGDGLKIGVLALIRSGHSVTIKSGDEIWHPDIEPAPEYDQAEVLTFNIRKSRMYRPSVEVEIENVSKVEWLAIASRFRFLPDRERGKIIPTIYGDLLLDKPGMLYVKGIFVEQVADMQYGYDFKDAELDVDRRTVASWARESECKAMLESAMNEEPALIRDIFRLLCEGKKDVTDFRYSGIRNQSITSELKKLWVEQYGEKTIPIATPEEGIKLQHLGVTGVVVNQTAVAALGAIVGTAESAMRELAFSTSAVYELDTVPESDVLLNALCVMESAGHPINLDYLQVVDFKDPDVLGQYQDGMIKISRTQLSKGLSPTVVTLAHELAHGKESRSVSHSQVLEALLEDVVTYLLGGKSN